MQQVEIRTVTQALTRSNEAIDGATLHGAALEVTRNTAAAITLNRTALSTARDSHEAGKLDLAARRALRDAKLEVVRAFIRIARDLLRPHLGNQYRATWTVAGFLGTLKIPVTPGKLVVLLETLAAYLEANPAVQIPALNITPEQAEAYAGDLLAAENAVTAQVVTVKNLLDTRNVKFVALQKRLKDLFKELSQVMTPLDNRWLAFGYNIPGAEGTPDQPENVVATLIEGGAYRVKWDRAARAAYYRVWVKVIGADTDCVHVGSSTDLDFILEGLPGNAQVEILVSASNSGGESARSSPFVVHTGVLLT